MSEDTNSSNDAALDTSSERIESTEEAGDLYTQDLEAIRDQLDADDESGTTLGEMVESQLELTNAEAAYQTREGIPKRVSRSLKDAADEVKRTGG